MKKLALFLTFVTIVLCFIGVRHAELNSGTLPALPVLPSASPEPDFAISSTFRPTPAPTRTPTPTPKPTATPSPTPRSLSSGDRGDDVADLQKRLNALGYSCGSADGIFGNKTAAALKAFQKRNDLPVTGVADSVTSAALYSFSALSPTPKPTNTPKPTPTPKPDKIVYVTRYGECWHTKPNCGNSKYVSEIWLSEAIEQGYRNCSNC